LPTPIAAPSMPKAVNPTPINFKDTSSIYSPFFCFNYSTLYILRFHAEFISASSLIYEILKQVQNDARDELLFVFFKAPKLTVNLRLF